MSSHRTNEGSTKKTIIDVEKKKVKQHINEECAADTRKDILREVVIKFVHAKWFLPCKHLADKDDDRNAPRHDNTCNLHGTRLTP